MTATPQAFLSYTRLDDRGHDGRITALRAALELQVRVVTGDDSFEIFQDVDAIAFGEHWPTRLEQALAASRFLIPVLSPRFFRSEPCRDELRKFLDHELAAGREDLILPIYWVEAAVLERPQLTATDELAVAIARRQRWDWRSHAMASISSQTVKRAIRDLARAIAGRLELEPAPKEESIAPLDRRQNAPVAQLPETGIQEQRTATVTAQAPTEAAETGGSLRDRPATEAKGEPTDRGRDVVTAERENCPTLTSPSHAPGTGQLTATPIASIEDGWSAESASARPDALNPRPNADSQESGNAGATAPTKNAAAQPVAENRQRAPGRSDGASTTSAQIVTEFGKKNDTLQVIVGGRSGALPDGVSPRPLSEPPSLDHLRCKMIGLLNAPASRLVGLLQVRQPGASLLTGAAMDAVPAPSPATEAPRRKPGPRRRAYLAGEVFCDVDAPWCPEMVVIPVGSFTMGSPGGRLWGGEEGRDNDEGPQRQVKLTRPFAMGRHTVTRRQFAYFVAATKHDISGGGTVSAESKRPSVEHDWEYPGFAQSDDHPVVCVSWKDARAYVAWLAEETGKPYRLPTEAEWEYAARAGTTTPFWTGATISPEQANYDGNYSYGGGFRYVYRQRTVAVDDPTFPANPFGLHHVHGNVWEWVQDSYCDSYRGAPLDGSIAVEAADAPVRVVRGGSWDDDPRNLRSAARVRLAPGDRSSNVGFRVARMLAA